MLLELKESEHARILQMEDYNRVGGKAVEAQSIDQAYDVLERDDISVSKLIIERSNSDEEAELIDSYIQQGMFGKYPYYLPTTNYRAKTNRETLKTNKKTRSVKISEEKIVAKRRFEAVLAGKFDTYPNEEDVEGAVERGRKKVEEAIEDKRETLEALEAELEYLEQMDRETFIEQYC